MMEGRTVLQTRKDEALMLRVRNGSRHPEDRHSCRSHNSHFCQDISFASSPRRLAGKENLCAYAQ